ncbi:MAG TPA: DUF2917 domain-containing protein [Paraburkholderia sp.]|jgi:quercetin dioxygenase-like cupin family protein|nr:DUF2917 domain-containing protein [Paraburkholderia sp.]
MREIRTFELGHDEPAAAWRVAQPLILQVLAGEVWLTLEGDAEDYWLAHGQSFCLPRDAVAWLSAGRDGARVAVSSAGGRGAGMQRVSRAGSWNWLPRWMQAA